MSKKQLGDDDLKDHKAIGVRLKKIRADFGQSISKVAKGAHISRASLEIMESGKRDYRIVTLWKVCKYYGIRIGELIEEAGKDIESLK